jgi:hypothetical protein
MRQTSLFQTVKAAALYHVPIKSYSKDTHPPSFLKRAVVSHRDLQNRFFLVPVPVTVTVFENGFISKIE